ncbi:hypothetical protein [Streptomyces sp.]|uniref:hypothetical protein n=1 Tax=Streptomyces sp. TaxID=1931 RepID=UPI0028116B33|nr:hypothetical protein [Streptomyces sp.]
MSPTPTANLFTVARPPPANLRQALADLLAVPAEAVDVADADGDQEGRNWNAPVLCTWRLLPPGDLALELDITVRDATAADLAEKDLAQGLAIRTGGSVLYPSGLDLPSAYWAAVPDGRTVRCRLEASDVSDGTAYRVAAAEEDIPDLPRASVEDLPEILDRQPLDTPVSDAFLATFPTGSARSAEGRVHYGLRVWERLVRRLETGWAPSGRYREDLFHRDLQGRDALEQLIGEVDEAYAGALREAVTRLDGTFLEYTETKSAGDGTTARWWWNRIPRRAPW